MCCGTLLLNLPLGFLEVTPRDALSKVAAMNYC
jgi:hypothetical protein